MIARGCTPSFHPQQDEWRMRQHYENVMELHVRHVKRLLTDFKGEEILRKCSQQSLSIAKLIACEPFSFLWLYCCAISKPVLLPASIVFTFNPLQIASDFVKVVCITFERICHWNKKASGRRSRGPK